MAVGCAPLFGGPTARTVHPSLGIQKAIFVPPDFRLNRLLRSQRDPGHHFLYREKVTKSGRGAPRAPVRGDSHPAGGVGPACRSIRGRIRASTGPLVERVLPKALGQRGGRQPSPPLVVAGSGLTFPPLGRMQEISPPRGPKGSLEPAGWPPLARKSF